MKLQTIPYTDYDTNLPKTGQHIVGQVQNGNIVVYQAFNPAIAAYAVQHQKFEGRKSYYCDGRSRYCYKKRGNSKEIEDR